MFFGTTPSIISQYLFQEFSKHAAKRVLVPFAGNFVVEQVARQALPDCELFSTDVSLYSRAIGFGITNQKSDIRLRADLAQDFPSFAGEDPMEKAAAVIFFSDVAKVLNKKDKLPYYEMQYRDAVNNQEKYKEKILAKLAAFQSKTGDFYFSGKDACLLLPEIKAGDLVFYDPPVAVGNYESEFRQLNACFEYEEEPYTVIDDQVKMLHLQEIHERGAILYWRTNNPLPEAPSNFKLSYQYRYKYHGIYCVYANNPKKNFVGGREMIDFENPGYKVIDQDFEFSKDTKINIIQTQNKFGNYYRAQWIRKAEMLDSGTCFLVFADEVLIGVIQLAAGVKFGNELILINSDPAPHGSNYKRLSKLILFLICTEFMIEWFNELSLWLHSGFTTRVFTNAPVSMKYRGLFELANREEDKEGNYDYKLIYQKREGFFKDSQEAYQKWFKKYGKQVWKKLKDSTKN